VTQKAEQKLPLNYCGALQSNNEFSLSDHIFCPSYMCIYGASRTTILKSCSPEERSGDKISSS